MYTCPGLLFCFFQGTFPPTSWWCLHVLNMGRIFSWLASTIHMARGTSRRFDKKSLFDILRALYGIEVIGGEQKLRAILSDKKLSEYLRLCEGMPLLDLERRFETNRSGYSICSPIFCNTGEQAVYGIF